MKRATREWVHKAEDDYQAAAKLAEGSGPFHDQDCFHCQQSAEKYLKALLDELGLHISKIHVLESHLLPLATHRGELLKLRRGLLFLTDFAVDMRYPGNNASKRQAMSALRWAGNVRESCGDILKIRPPRRK